MAVVKRKSRLHQKIRLNPFLLFVMTSVAIHGLVVLRFIFKRSPVTQEEPTPIDFVIVPPEETPAEPPPDTERQADQNSVAKGDVKPELPTATDKIDSEQAVATPESPTQPQTTIVPPTPPQANTPAPEPQAEASPPVTPPSPPTTAIAPTSPVTPPNEIKPNPPVEKEPKPVAPQPSAEPTETANDPPPLPKEPKPVANTPLLSRSDTSISVPKETTSTEENPFKPDLPSKSEVTESLPRREEIVPPTEENPFKPDLPDKPEVTESLPQREEILPPTETEIEPDLPDKPEVTESLPQPEETPPTETEIEPDSSPVATNLPPKPKPIEPSPTQTPPENTSVPETPTPEQETAVGSGSASLLQGTQSRSSSSDSDSTFFNPEANASEQAVNPSGVDAQQNVDLGPYYAEVKRRVKQNWQPSSPGDNRQTVLAFSIGRNGQIIGLRVRQSSGSPEVDQKTLEAVQKSGPFAPLPANYPDQQLEVEFNFNIYVDGGEFTPDLESWQRF